MPTMQPILCLPENAQGKDYVLGDLHGCFDLLSHLLAVVDFNFQTDRVFSVGDLIDRGADSLRCITLTGQSWFHAVRGNHEQMLLDYFSDYQHTGSLEALEEAGNNCFLNNGGDWVEQYFLSEQQCMTDDFNAGLQLINRLPFIIIVGTGSNRFHIIHAELVKPGYRSAKSMVWLDSDIDSWIPQKRLRADIEDRLLWGRSLMSNLYYQHCYPAIQPGLSTTFCGHTLASKPRQILSHLCVDTGGFASGDSHKDYALSLFDVKERKRFAMAYKASGVVIEDFKLC